MTHHNFDKLDEDGSRGDSFSVDRAINDKGQRACQGELVPKLRLITSREKGPTAATGALRWTRPR